MFDDVLMLLTFGLGAVAMLGALSIINLLLEGSDKPKFKPYIVVFIETYPPLIFNRDDYDDGVVDGTELVTFLHTHLESFVKIISFDTLDEAKRHVSPIPQEVRR